MKFILTDWELDLIIAILETPNPHDHILAGSRFHYKAMVIRQIVYDFELEKSEYYLTRRLQEVLNETAGN